MINTDSWTTLWGGLAAIGTALAAILPPKYSWVGSVIATVGIALLGKQSAGVGK